MPQTKIRATEKTAANGKSAAAKSKPASSTSKTQLLLPKTKTSKTKVVSPRRIAPSTKTGENAKAPPQNSLERGRLARSGDSPTKVDFKKACDYLTKNDSKLGKIIARVGPCKLEPEAMQSPFEALAKAIIYQQLSGKAAATIFGRIKALYGDKDILEPEDILMSSEDKLRGAGCSRAKAAALRDLAEKTNDGVVPTLDEMSVMSDDELIERLSSVRGVGRWTVEMLLMFRLGRMDVLPSTDYGIRKGYAIMHKLIDLPTPREILEYGERWKPFRTVASWYLWRALDP